MHSHWLKRFAAGVSLAFCCVVVSPSVAHADEAAAETLFQEGLAAMKRNDFAVACEAFAQSNKADPSPGTQLNLALCFEKQKKWASAWSWYRSAVGLAQQRGQKEREKLAEDAANRLKPLLHSFVVVVSEPLEDLVVERDGAPVTTTVGGKEVPLPVDPGEHTLRVSARGKQPWTTTFKVPETPGSERIEVPKLVDVPKEAPTPTAPVAPVKREEKHDGSTQRILGLVTAGAGVVTGLAAGGVFLLAKSEESERESLRSEAATKTGALRRELDRAAGTHQDAAESNQLLAAILGGGAVVMIGVGAVLYFTAPKAETAPKKANVTPLLGPGMAGVGLSGTF